MNQDPNIYDVKPGPNPETEKLVPYYEAAAKFLQRRFLHAPSRETLRKYKEHGYPVRRGGPYVTIPVIYALHRPMTSVEALTRFEKTVRHADREADACVTA